MASGRMIFCNASHSRAARVPTHGGAPRATSTETPREPRGRHQATATRRRFVAHPLHARYWPFGEAERFVIRRPSGPKTTKWKLGMTTSRPQVSRQALEAGPASALCVEWCSRPRRARSLLAHFRQRFVHQCRFQAQPGLAKRLDDRSCCADDAAMAAENDNAQSAYHGKAQTACAATCRQIVQDDLRSWPFKSMGQDLGLPGPQVPEADPIGNRSIVNLKYRGEILDLVGRPVAIGPCLDLPDHGLWYDKELCEGSQEIETLDAGEENQRRSIDDQGLIHAPGPRRDPPASPGKPRRRSPTGHQ